MPNMKAAVKALRQSEKRRVVNRNVKEKVKMWMKEMRKLAAAKKFDEFKTKLPEMMSTIDKATKQHLLHPNNAARKKSALAHLLASK